MILIRISSLILLAALSGSAFGQKIEPAEIYQSSCASCHGSHGQGKTEHFEPPLVGDLSLGELTRYIVESMPEEDPDQCVGEEAAQVAKYIFDKFYSPAARSRNQQARVQLSRLTVRQYRQCVADLVESFHDDYRIPKERGLQANYFAARNWTEKRRLAKQIDQNIDFGDGVPHFDPQDKYPSLKKEKPKKGANKMNQGFSAFWTGSLLPSETGVHELIVESKNGFKLFVNDRERPLIDRKVRSDEVVEHRTSLFMIRGRPYSFHLEMFSYPIPPAKMKVLWKPPGKPLSVIPPTAFFPEQRSEILSVSTEFPPDDASFGFERGINVSDSWDNATTRAAIEGANWIAERIWRLAKTKPGDNRSKEKIKEFLTEFVGRAFVKPLSEQERQDFIDQHFELDLAVEDQVKRVVILALKSPRFLYPSLEVRQTDFERVRRAALVLWDSLPDNRLHVLLQKGRLSEPQQLDQELKRMVAHPRSREKLNSFFRFWLKADQHGQLRKDEEAFPEFDAAIQADLKDSLFLFLDHIVWNERSDFRDLFLADYLFVNQRLAKFYDLEPGPKDYSKDYSKVNVDPTQRAGILTHPFLMTGLAYHKDSSPIHRGVFVAKSLLGRTLRQPPEAVEPLSEEFDPKMTTRQRVEHQTKESACMNCHSVINPLGFSLENFDAVGRFRTKEKHKPVDVTSVYRTPDGKSVRFNGPRDLAKFLAENKMAQKSFVRQLFNHYTKQPIEAFGSDQLEQLHEQFSKNEFNIQHLLVDIAKVAIAENLDQQVD